MPFLLMECPLLLVSTRYVTARDGARLQMASIDEDTSYEEKRKKGHQKRGCAQGNECPPCQVSCHVHGCYVTQHRDIPRLYASPSRHQARGRRSDLSRLS